MTPYSYEEFIKDIPLIGEDLLNENFDAIVGVARGGLTFAHFLSQLLNQRNLYTINSIHYEDTKKLEDIEIFNTPNLKDHEKVIVVDDIVDSGDTLDEILTHLKKEFPNIEFQSASIFYKSTAKISPNYYLHEAKDWIDFFWDKDTR